MNHSVSGVYCITNRIDGKMYVGSARNCANRWKQHRKDLRSSLHHSVKLQRAWNKYGAEAFVFAPMLICSEAHRLFYEQLMLDACGAVAHGYNISPTAGSCLGVRHTPETRAKLSRIRTGKTYPPMSEEQKGKLRAQRIGKKHTPEHNAKIAAAGRGRTHTDATKQKLRLAKLGKPLSADHIAKAKAGQQTEEARMKMRLANLGRKRGPMSEEQKAKISVALKGRVVSEENRRLTSIRSKGNTYCLGKVASAEKKAKCSAGLKAAWAAISDEERERRRLLSIGNKANTGRKLSDEDRAKKSLAAKNATPETRAKRGAAIRAAFAAKRARTNNGTLSA